jgi:putative FmdB family regulatory protein
MIGPDCRRRGEHVPIYEYRCEHCGVTFEKFYRSAAAAGDAACPSCGRPGRRLLSLFSRPRGAQPGSEEGERERAGDEHDHEHEHEFGGHSHGALHGHHH